MWKSATLAAAWLWCTRSAAAQEPSAPEEQAPSISALAALIDSQKALIERQAMLEELQDRMRKVEDLALANHNRL